MGLWKFPIDHHLVELFAENISSFWVCCQLANHVVESRCGGWSRIEPGQDIINDQLLNGSLLGIIPREQYSSQWNIPFRLRTEQLRLFCRLLEGPLILLKHRCQQPLHVPLVLHHWQKRQWGQPRPQKSWTSGQDNHGDMDEEGRAHHRLDPFLVGAKTLTNKRPSVDVGDDFERIHEQPKFFPFGGASDDGSERHSAILLAVDHSCRQSSGEICDNRLQKGRSLVTAVGPVAKVDCVVEVIGRSLSTIHSQT
jgi:hypothetical protein